MEDQGEPLDRVWVSMNRKVNLGNYNSMDVGVGMSVNVPTDTPRLKILAEIEGECLKNLKAVVKLAQKEVGEI